MRFLRRFLMRLSNFATRRGAVQRLQAEIAEHLAFQTEENMRAGKCRPPRRDGRPCSGSARRKRCFQPLRVVLQGASIASQDAGNCRASLAGREIDSGALDFSAAPLRVPQNRTANPCERMGKNRASAASLAIFFCSAARLAWIFASVATLSQYGVPSYV